jgi:hypothetical protein
MVFNKSILVLHMRARSCIPRLSPIMLNPKTPKLCNKATLFPSQISICTHSSSLLGILIYQLLGPGCIPSHQLYSLPISMMKILVL